MDELRTQVSAVFVKQCMEEGQRQLEHKENLAAKNLEIETKWARLWEWDRIQKGKREERELAERERLNAHTKQVLDEQTAMRERMRNANNGERDAELRKFAEIARIDAEKQAKREEAMAAAKRTAQREILKFNTEYEANKAAQKAQQLAEERSMNAAAAASLAGEGALKEAEKQARMEDMKNYTSYLNKLKQDQAFMDAELDRMRAIAQEQAWEVREQKWSKERAAREALMRDVQETIHEQLAYRAREKISQTQQGKLEQQKIQTELDRLAAKEAAKQQADMEWRQQANRELLQQMADRERARQEEFDAGVRAAAEEKARQDRIAAMLAAELVANKPVKTNFPIKSMKWYT